MKHYLIRLDDASPFMNKSNWARIECLLDKYNVKPLVGVIPSLRDKEIMIEDEDPDFWAKPLKWQNKGWSIALHGYDHVYISTNSGINPLWHRSEFAGLSLQVQKDKIRKGVDILRSAGIDPHFFFAPSHTFDDLTLKALKEETNINVISDTIALKPYKKDDFVFIPQISGHCVNIPVPGVYTFCFHPNSMKDKDYMTLEKFLENNWKAFIPFSAINVVNVGPLGLLDRGARFFYFLLRTIKGLR